MTRVLSMLAGWKGYALLALAAYAMGAHNGWTVRDWKADADTAAARIAAAEARTRAVSEARRIERKASAVTSRIETRAAEAQIVIREVTRTLIEEVPVHVPPAVDARFDVPVGFVRLHDAAAAGSSVVPDPAGVPDDAPSGLALSAVAAGVVGNYGQCHAVARQLTDLQDWVTAQAALFDGADP